MTAFDDKSNLNAFNIYYLSIYKLENIIIKVISVL